MPYQCMLASGNSELDPNSQPGQENWKWACEICHVRFDTYQETDEHEEVCEKNINNKVVLDDKAKKISNGKSGTDTRTDRKSKKKKPKTSKGSSGPEPVPLNCSLTKRKAEHLCRLDYLLVDNLELHQHMNADRSTYMALRCSNCYAHSMRLYKLGEMQNVVMAFGTHFANCSSTLKSIRDEIKDALSTGPTKTSDVLQEYCTFLHDLYGLVDTKVGSRGETHVKFGPCRYILIAGYKPNAVQYKPVPDLLPKDMLQPPLLSAPTTVSQSTHHTAELPTLTPTIFVLSDYDHFVVSQFQLLCDRIRTPRTEAGILQNHCKILVCCKHCTNIPVPGILSIHDLVAVKKFASHLRNCNSFHEQLKSKMMELKLLKESQIRDVDAIVPLEKYIKKTVMQQYEIRDSKHGGMVIRSNPFPDAVVNLSSTIPFVIPLMDENFCQCVSPIHPSIND